MKVFALAFAAAAAALGPVSAQYEPCDPLLEANKELYVKALDAIWNKKSQAAIDQYLSPTFAQHNPTTADGTDGLREAMKKFPLPLKLKFGTVVAEGNFVWDHSYSESYNLLAVDIYRIENGVLLEHWDILQPVTAAETANGRPMFPITPTMMPRANGTNACGSDAPTLCMAKTTLQANKKLVAEAVDLIFNQKDTARMDDYIAEGYKENNPFTPDGREGLKGYIRSLPSTYKYELGSSVAGDDLVWLHGRQSGRPGALPNITIDIFRIKDGKLVEHWDVVQFETPQNETISGRPMFPLGA